jgi:protein-disulfide isomerase
VKRIIFGGACLVLVLGFFLGANYYRESRAENLSFMARDNASIFVRPHSATLGSDEAGVYIVKFTDPACETCASFSPYMKQALKAFPGRVKVVIRYAPFHKGSWDIVRILEASKKQEKFWETLEVLYRRQRSWTQHHVVQLDQVWQFLPEAGLDVERVRTDMKDPAITAIIEQDLADARVLGVRKTPGFFVNGKPLEPFGAQQLATLIKSEIAARYPD